MTFLLFLISAFAVSRVSDIIAEEEGPLSVFRRLRRKVPARTNAGRGIRCPYCVGVWIAGMATAWVWWIGLVPGPMTPLWLFGISGAAAAIKSASE